MAIAGLRFLRLLRTLTSERFLAQGPDGSDLASIDVHYLASGNVAATVVIFGDGQATESTIASLLERVDAELLPDVSIQTSNLSFTVVKGEVIGNFVPDTRTSKT